MRTKPFAVLLACLMLPAGHALADKTVYGLIERVALPDLGVELDAKLDTGAETASLGARDIERFERDGERWVRFVPDFRGHPEQVLELPLARVSKIKRRPGDFHRELDKSYTARPVVELHLCMGNRLREIEVNLTDRSAFKYPLLIGSDALAEFGALVDPSLTQATAEPNCTDADE